MKTPKDIRVSSLHGEEFFRGVIVNNGRPLVMLVDGNNFCIRAYYSIKESKYRKTDSPFERCFTMLTSLLGRVNMNAVVFCFDSGREFREALIKSNKCWIGAKAALGYKGHRTLRDSPEFPEIQQLLADFQYHLANTLGIPTVAMPGVEADDLLFALSRWFVGINKVVLSADEDLVQCCVNPNTAFFSTKKDFLLNRRIFDSHCGYPVEGYARLKAIVGDSSDNIEGVYGVAEKTLQKWCLRTGHIPFNFLGWLDKYAPEDVKTRFGDADRAQNWKTSLLAISLPYFFNKFNTDDNCQRACSQLSDYGYSEGRMQKLCSDNGFALSSLVAASTASTAFLKQQHGMKMLERIWYDQKFNRCEIGKPLY